MSYARWGCDGSDVYVYHGRNSDGSAVYVCCRCKVLNLPPDGRGSDGERADVMLDTPAAMLEHLVVHRAAGDCVPEYTLERLRGDVAAGGYRADGYPDAVAATLRKAET